MKISLNWIKEFVDIPIPVNELVLKIGSQLGEVDNVKYIGDQYKNIVVVRVVSCVQHPNADKLKLCLIDDGKITPDIERTEEGYVQVVCGAPNVRANIKTAWLPPSSIVPISYYKDPLILSVRDIRGIKSNGMLGSGHELNINDDHDGIIMLDDSVAPGTQLCDVLKLDDYIIEIENKMFTHRPDCFGMMGIAREIAGICHVPFKSPNWYKEIKEVSKLSEGISLPFIIDNQLPNLVPRFSAITLSNISVKPSSLLVQSYLFRLGIRPINNIVDITNFYMMMTSQPLHAYDYDKLKALCTESVPKIIIRKPRSNETVTLINGKNIEPNDNTILIATQDHILGLGGVMGGLSTEIDDNTQNILLECANFDMFSIRKTSMEYGIQSEAVTRFNKGQSIRQNLGILSKLIEEYKNSTDANVASEIYDEKSKEPQYNPIEITTEFINNKLGLHLKTEEIAMLLSNVEIGITIKNSVLIVEPPFWRTDITIDMDVVEEVGRLYGLENVPLVLPQRIISPVEKNIVCNFKDEIRSYLSKAGANEVLTYSFINGKLLNIFKQESEIAFQITNALSPALQFYRLSLTPSILEKVRSNIKNGYKEFVLFEIGKFHNKLFISTENIPKENEVLSIVFASANKISSGINHVQGYYEIKTYLTYLFEKLGRTYTIGALKENELPEYLMPQFHTFEGSRAATIIANGEIIGIFGEISTDIKLKLKLPVRTAALEIDINKFLLLPESKDKYRQLSKFPRIEQDITLQISRTITFSEVKNIFEQELDKITNIRHTIEPINIYSSDNDEINKSITLHITLYPQDRTFNNSEVNNILDKISHVANELIGAIRK
ncbi:MAG: phenylalanine--tRNA ligase subunit beta [Candidatus Saccharimonadales bacterium]